MPTSKGVPMLTRCLQNMSHIDAYVRQATHVCILSETES